MKNNKYLGWGWFLFGLGSQLQIAASLSFTEVFCYFAAPVLFSKELPYLRRNGMMPFFWISIALVVNAVISCLANQTNSLYVLRGMAVVCLIPCTIITGHWMLRRDMAGFKWMLVGSAISTVLCTFIFQRSVEVSMLAEGEAGVDAAEAIMNGPIYWIGRAGSFVNLIPQGWYLQCPTAVAVALPTGMAFFSLLTSVSGRSTALGAMGSAMFVFLGGKSRERIKRNVCNRFWLLCFVGIVTVFIFKTVYEYTAASGVLGEEAQEKYERQTKGSKSITKLLLGGRMESFCGLLACVNKPIIGFGPWAMDEDGYTQRFLSEYADYEDYINYIQTQESCRKLGLPDLHMIPCHAYITEFWCWFGIFGLFFWLYVIFVLIRYLRHDCFAVPHWYYWLAAGIPGYLWGVFFSPFSARVSSVVFVVAVLLVRAVRKGTQPVPEAMIRELNRR